MKEMLRELCLLNGVSGDEDKVRNYIISAIGGLCDYSVDNLGNLICFKKGKKTPEKKLMVCAHMDEVGFIITSVRNDGTLSFEAVGGIEASSAMGKQVKVGKNLISGVIGSAAVHNLSKEQREKAPQLSGFYIDIGAANKEAAEKYASPGDCVYFDSEYTELGGSCVKSKAIDDRAGCAVMIKLMQQELEYDTYFVFNVQEEIGLRGAAVSAYSVQPDIAFVLEATTASDIDGVTGAKRVCALGGGPVVSFMDRSTMYDRELYRKAFETAENTGIPCQTKSMVAGGNDSGAIHISGKGVRTLAVSVPCRYLHSPSCVIDLKDFENTYRLVRELIKKAEEL